MTDQDPDKQLFRDAVGDARPIRSRKVVPSAPKPKAQAAFTRADEKSVQHESLQSTPDDFELDAGDELSYARAGVARTVLRKLRRGGYKVQGEIDLHGLTVSEAKEALSQFLQECQARKESCVRIVHGKGKRSGQRGPVLKGKVNLWLRRRGDVLAFVSTPRNDGGTGALYVLLESGA